LNQDQGFVFLWQRNCFGLSSTFSLICLPHTVRVQTALEDVAIVQDEQLHAVTTCPISSARQSFSPKHLRARNPSPTRIQPLTSTPTSRLPSTYPLSSPRPSNQPIHAIPNPFSHPHHIPQTPHSALVSILPFTAPTQTSPPPSALQHHTTIPIPISARRPQ
jgi:hypothetical protein